MSYDHFTSFAMLELDAFGDLLYSPYESHCDQIIISAGEMLTAEVTNATYAHLLRVQLGDPVAVIECVACGYDRVPLEWRRSCGATAHFRYHVDIR